VHTSSDDTAQGRQEDSSSEGEHQHRLRLEKVSEVSENTEDDSEKSILDHSGRLMAASNSPLKHGAMGISESQVNGSGAAGNGAMMAGSAAATAAASATGLSRKDSFHQWSSDEETNIMMNRMRAFFRSMLVRRPSPEQSMRKTPPQLALFEQQLTRLMKTVPGIRDEQVREIVEYLSSEETWSDSYDSSDYTDYTSSDLEGGGGLADKNFPGAAAGFPDLEDVHVLEDQVSAINRLGEGVAGGHGEAETDDFQKETAIMYQKLMNSVVARMQFNSEGEGGAAKSSSPPLAAKIMHHISSRLVTLMHEVSAGSDNSSLASISDSRQNLYNGRRPSPITTSSPKVGEGAAAGGGGRRLRLRDTGPGSRHQLLNSSMEEEEEEQKDGANNAGYTFASLDSPKVLIGPNLGAAVGGGSPQPSNPFRFTKNTSKSVEILDLGRRRASLDDKNLKLSSIAKATSTEYDVWQGVHRAVEGSGRRGSLPRGQLDLATHSSSSGTGTTAHIPVNLVTVSLSVQ
jgi:synaptotagmin-like protein